MSADHYLLFILYTVVNGRQEISQGFTGPRSGFDQQMLVFLKSPHDLIQHHVLGFSLLILRQTLSQPFPNLFHELLERHIRQRISIRTVPWRLDVQPILHLQGELTIVHETIFAWHRLAFLLLRHRIEKPAQIAVLACKQIGQTLQSQQRQLRTFLHTFQENERRRQRIAVRLMRPIMLHFKLRRHQPELIGSKRRKQDFQEIHRIQNAAGKRQIACFVQSALQEIKIECNIVPDQDDVV
ncbi:hypothetical protein D3C74_260160 [compost metagenome]